MKKVELTSNALEVAQSRYFMAGEDWEAASNRVANTISMAETSNRDQCRDAYAQMIYNMDFLPGGRILRNCGRARGSLFNCYHLPIGDSIEEIGQFIKDSLILWSEGGGVGCNFTPLRPKDDAILGKGGKSSGLVSFIEAADSVSKTIESGGARRAAAIAHVDVSHPEVIDFIDAKMLHGKLSHFNISVSVTDDFLECVEADEYWTFKFKQKEYGKVKARDIWNKIVKNMVECAEPGLLNWSNFQKNNSYYFEPVLGTNPCLTGDTLVAVADGRGEISIGELAKEDKDVPVYSLNESSGNVEVKIMRRPRVTGFKKKILKITLDDNSVVRCTENHKLMMRDGTVKEAKDLVANDRLHHMVKTSEYRNYVSMNTTNKRQLEHRIIGEFIKGDKLSKNEVVHHKNEICDDNRLENLQVMEKGEHNRYHLTGDKNPMRKWFKDLNHFESNQYKINMSNSTSGNKNGRWMGWSFEMIDKELRSLIKKNNGPISIKEWKNYCKKYNIPYWSSEVFKNNFSSIDNYIKSVLRDYDFDYSPTMMRSYKRYLKLREKTDLKLVFDKKYKGMRVVKNCEYCEKEFLTTWELRERAFCCRSCCNKSVSHRSKQRLHNKNQDKIRRTQIISFYKDLKEELNRDPLSYELHSKCKEEKVPYTIYGKDPKPNEYAFSSFNEIKQEVINDLNYKVVSVEFDGYEDVYNGTVDHNHNFYIYTKNTTKNNRTRKNYINCLQCGETTLGPYGVCDLGSLVLPNFITGSINTNWKKLENIIKTGVRFLDGVIDVNKYALKEIDINAHKSRRIGIGVIGLAEYLFAKKVRYGSERAVAETERLMRFIRDATYQASMELAIEKGAFPQFDSIPFGKASFIRKLPAQLRMDIKKYGVRNCTSMALAPTGTISLLADYTSAIEPLFAKAMIRKDRISERMYIHPKYQEIIEKNEEVPDWFVDSYDLQPKDHFEMQVACQKYCDGAVSKTINLPKETTQEDLSSLLLEYIHDLKGVTVYRDGSREGQILNQVSDKDARAYLNRDVSLDKDAIVIDNNLDESQVKCGNGNCEL